MEKIPKILFLSVVLVSWYEDYVKAYDYDAVYFPYQTDVRTFVVGEGMKIEIGVTLGGVMVTKKPGMSISSFGTALLQMQYWPK